MGIVTLGVLATECLLSLTALASSAAGLQEPSQVDCAAWDQRFRAWYWGTVLAGLAVSLLAVFGGVKYRLRWAARPYGRLFVAAIFLFLFPALLSLLAWVAGVSGGAGLPALGISSEYLECNEDFGSLGLVFGIGKAQALVFQPLLLAFFAFLAGALWFALLAGFTWVAARWYPRVLKENHAG